MQGIYHPAVSEIIEESTYESLSAHKFPEGITFPESPTEKDFFYRTDLNILHFYDGTDWIILGGAAVGLTVESSIAIGASYTPTEGGLYFIMVSVTFNHNNVRLECYSTAGSRWLGGQNRTTTSYPWFLSDGENVRITNYVASTAYFTIWRFY